MPIITKTEKQIRQWAADHRVTCYISQGAGGEAFHFSLHGLTQEDERNLRLAFPGDWVDDQDQRSGVRWATMRLQDALVVTTYPARS